MAANDGKGFTAILIVERSKRGSEGYRWTRRSGGTKDECDWGDDGEQKEENRER